MGNVSLSENVSNAFGMMLGLDYLIVLANLMPCLSYPIVVSQYYMGLLSKAFSFFQQQVR